MLIIRGALNLFWLNSFSARVLRRYTSSNRIFVAVPTELREKIIGSFYMN
jgi:hypothetical protein